jgi:thioesterase domain-containing protein
MGGFTLYSKQSGVWTGSEIKSSDRIDKIMSIDLRETEASFHRLIPITRAMGVQLTGYDGSQLVIEAPLSLNHNHLGTAFGGSLNTIATLAGYGLVWLELGDPASHVVIRESSIAFRHPVTKDIRAICRRPDQATMTEFKEHFLRKNRARLRLRATIEQDGKVCVEFEGVFVAMR